MKQLISISLIVALIFSCSDGEESGISVDNIDGFVQKGPYIGGTQVQIISLNSDLSQTGTNYTTEIDNDQGFFSINNINLLPKSFMCGAPHVMLPAGPKGPEEMRAQLHVS